MVPIVLVLTITLILTTLLLTEQKAQYLSNKLPHLVNMNEIDLQVLVSTESLPIYSISMSRGNAHIVIKLLDVSIIGKIIDFLSAYGPNQEAKWIEIGSFGPCPTTLYCNQ